MHIGRRQIGDGRPCYVIAEAGVNHNGDVRLALRLIDVAADAGADAVKFQTFRADAVARADAPKADYQLRTTAADESQHAMLRQLELSREDHRRLVAHCRERGITFLSTAFDEASVDLLAELDMAAFKVPSGEATNRLLLEYVAKQRRPVILSTGMCDLAEVRAAVDVLREGGCSALAVLHCVTSYPAAPDTANLRAMATLRDALQLPVGYSDHTLGTHIALAAVTMGACIIEKHVTLDRTMPGPDHAASLEPAELTRFVRELREVESAMGDGVKQPAACELDIRSVVRRSLVAASDIPAGSILTREMLIALRPGDGLSPMRIDAVLGRRTRSPLRRGERVDEAM
jgi:N,N'-diacetyllegionaminate synthase